jgi:hypothetical protein
LISQERIKQACAGWPLWTIFLFCLLIHPLLWAVLAGWALFCATESLWLALALFCLLECLLLIEQRLEFSLSIIDERLETIIEKQEAALPPGMASLKDTLSRSVSLPQEKSHD